jgi:hypothetical protein
MGLASSGALAPRKQQKRAENQNQRSDQRKLHERDPCLFPPKIGEGKRRVSGKWHAVLQTVVRRRLGCSAFDLISFVGETLKSKTNGYMSASSFFDRDRAPPSGQASGMTKRLRKYSSHCSQGCARRLGWGRRRRRGTNASRAGRFRFPTASKASTARAASLIRTPVRRDL